MICSLDGTGTVCSATPGGPSPEVCDGKDNDCNGVTDDLPPQACYTGLPGTEGVGICRAGIQVCENGTWSTCIGEVTPQEEKCDGKDNNCDGQVDEGCCEVDASVSPEWVVPQKTGAAPGTDIADITVWLNKPSPPAGCTIDLKVYPVPYSGGHKHHDALRHKGSLDKSMVYFPEGNTGPERVKYTSSEVAGTEEIILKERKTGKEIVQRIDVKVRGLGPLSAGANYELVGTPDNHTGTNDPCRWPPPTSLHYENHYGTENLIRAVENIAIDYAFYYPGVKLRINDVSLPWGGLFDIGNNWSSSPGHKTHRIGINADIGFNGIGTGGQCVGLKKKKLYELIRTITNREPYPHDDHYHITVSQ